MARHVVWTHVEGLNINIKMFTSAVSQGHSFNFITKFKFSTARRCGFLHFPAQWHDTRDKHLKPVCTIANAKTAAPAAGFTSWGARPSQRRSSQHAQRFASDGATDKRLPQWDGQTVRWPATWLHLKVRTGEVGGQTCCSRSLFRAAWSSSCRLCAVCVCSTCSPAVNVAGYAPGRPSVPSVPRGLG